MSAYAITNEEVNFHSINDDDALAIYTFIRCLKRRHLTWQRGSILHLTHLVVCPRPSST